MDNFTADELAAATDRFYPNWWIHRTSVAEVSDRPEYCVIVHDDREHRLALACKPPYLDVTVNLPS